MCRQNQLFGGCLLSFGAGMLIGTWLASGLLSHLLGIGLIILGIWTLRKP